MKRALQDGLPDEQRREMLDALFREHVTDDERAFADALYLTLDGCRELVRRGHEVIGHGWEHRRLGLLDEAAQREELERTRDVRRVRRRHVGALLPVRQPQRDDACDCSASSAAPPASRPTHAARRATTRCSSCRASTRTTYSSR